ncbi:MAG: hypothetical protein HY517_02950 [Candidatus Aenigmarchaeota archaeon]|nr:hypothetical protein [Candidatus Aenigmarchaeota archaeon]
MRIIKVRPTDHYIRNHSDVEWELVVRTVLSPNKVRAERIQNRFTYVKRFKKFVVEIHAEYSDLELAIYVINAFKMPKGRMRWKK